MNNETSNNDAIPKHQADVAEAVQRLKTAQNLIAAQLEPIIFGQKSVVEEVLISLFCRGHCILEGAPGLAKTLMISTLSQTLDLSFRRIQFTPDLMPADITGVDVIEEDRSTGTRDYRFIEGPIFANIVLADEINRTPPKTQAALLEAMQERQVTVGRTRHVLPDPFFVLATQNPIEQEGTYPLPEAQQDRFMFKTLVDYPSVEDEFRIGSETTGQADHSVEAVLSGDDILSLQRMVRQVVASDHVIGYVVALVRGTRPQEEGSPNFIRDNLAWGAGPRAVQFLILGGKARALLNGRTYITTQDIAELAKPVLRHRLLLNYAAESDGESPDMIIEKLLEATPREEDALRNDPRFRNVFRTQ
jgi:MoxR-like ATPase